MVSEQFYAQLQEEVKLRILSISGTTKNISVLDITHDVLLSDGFSENNYKHIITRLIYAKRSEMAPFKQDFYPKSYCYNCKEEYGLEMFRLSRRLCEKCYRACNKERINENQRRWKANNKDRVSELNKKYRANVTKEQAKAYRDKNKEKYREQQKEYREKNKEQRAAYRREYYLKNKK